MVLLDQLTGDLANAQKSKDEVKISTLRLIIAKAHNAKIAKGEDLTDDEVLAEIAKDAKRHRESIEAFEAGGRSDLAKKEKAELAILETYLPKPLSESELANMVSEAIAAVGAKQLADLGKVIKAVISSAGARAEGAKVAEIARKKLSP